MDGNDRRRRPCRSSVPLPNGGYFILEATARDTNKRFAVTRTSFYALGDGYTAWARFDHNRIELVPERRTYKPGDTARIMIQSPWEQATALVTTEREGVRSHRQFALTSTQQSISVPITEDDIPNVFVSVLLVKGRGQAEAKTAEPTATRPGERGENEGPNVVEDPSDPGKPAFRLGYVELNVEDAAKRLTVGVRADKEEYRPANAAKVLLDVKDANGRGAPSEVTLWAVDYGVLSLTAYRTPGCARVGLRAQGAAGHERRQPPAHHQPARADAERRDRRRRRWRGRRRWHAAEGFPRAGVLARIGRDRRVREGRDRGQAARSR